MKEELDLSLIEKLEKLRLFAKKIKITGTFGERKSPKVGRGSEFADYRNYQIGDELRYIDWNIYARLEKFLIKLFEEEEDLDIHILLDSSLSMKFGKPSKLLYGKELALAFAYLGLSSWEKIRFASFQESINNLVSLERKKESIFNLFRVLKIIKPSGITDINNVLKQYLSWQKRKGVLIVISDFLSPTGYKEGLSLAKYKKFSIYAIQILGEEEINPPLKGDLLLVDCETNEKREVLVDENLIEIYKRELDKFLKELEEFTSNYGIEYLRTVTSLPVEDLLLKYLRSRGWLT
ncbi:MAG: DUF58 domain-containing protein [Dictyoglomus sp.]|nr:DUF58 domain-containing protein [Dictyoglomus sp.]MCX7942794.1 DUF58 domain-containing protein [Dictyoglomaceae bacterium]MDW8188398.1 DUF58 domain-containing protein [Dictyoglomus sp.]